MNIAVRGIGIISALGNGAGETLAALRAGRSGIGKLTLFRSAVDVPVGEVVRDNRALGDLLGIPVLLAACPTAMLVTALCLQYDRSDAFASKCIFINTILSAATIPLVIWLLF